MKGRVVLIDARSKLDRVRTAAGLTRWPNNGLRHSFASYRLAAIHAIRVESFSDGQLRARRHLGATWVVHVDPSHGTVWNNLNCHINRLRARLINYVVYVPATDVSEALACAVGGGRAVGLIDRERSLYHCDQTWTGMAVPASLTSGLEGDLRDIDV